MNKLIFITVLATIAYGVIAAGDDDAHAETLKFDSNIDHEGNYKYFYETSNGIKGEEEGTGGHHARGSFSFYSPEHEEFQVQYVADENGFQPSAKHLPTPPPIPIEIVKSLEYQRDHHYQPEY
ncbi:pupal cuticle protein Edg-78E-like [Stomoxys calcitrans]|uniref:Pupal cuticle protein Edg-78E n=1 Tax=Stomoxys calcitrans TaxID=35570 RepID=A0A1I8PP93_STOCA|nr:pupal cuticle protein Edg-78E-like [Stomoxys calcitrans]